MHFAQKNWCSPIKVLLVLLDLDLEYKDYYALVEPKQDFAHTVWQYSEKKTPLYTLYGEFKANGFNVGQNNRDALKEDYGSLVMYYHPKTDAGDAYVLNPNGSETLIKKEYSENSATSMFYISTVERAKVNESNCTFAALKDKESLEDLQDAIIDYMEDNSETEFLTSNTVMKEPGDKVVGKQQLSVKYQVPSEPITIKSVRITKY